MLLRFTLCAIVVNTLSMLTLALTSSQGRQQYAEQSTEAAVAAAGDLVLAPPALATAEHALEAAAGLSLLPLLWLGVVYYAVVRDSKALEVTATITVSLLLLWPVSY